MCSVSVTRAMRAALSSFSSDSHLYGVAPPVCRWPQRLKPASSSAMMAFRWALLKLLWICRKCKLCLGFLVSSFFISSMARLYCQRFGGGTWTAIQRCGNWSSRFSCLPSSTPNSSVSGQYLVFLVQLVTWKFNFLSGTVFKCNSIS